MGLPDGRTGQARGLIPLPPIDLVAMTTDGKKIAIQVKARGEDYKASLDDVKGVVARANTEDWDEVRFYHTGGGMTTHVKELAEANGDRIKIYNRAAIARQCADWKLEFPGVNEKWPQRLKSGNQETCSATSSRRSCG